jgi:hypothetical protein
MGQARCKTTLVTSIPSIQHHLPDPTCPCYCFSVTLHQICMIVLADFSTTFSKHIFLFSTAPPFYNTTVALPIMIHPQKTAARYMCWWYTLLFGRQICPLGIAHGTGSFRDSPRSSCNALWHVLPGEVCQSRYLSCWYLLTVLLQLVGVGVGRARSWVASTGNKLSSLAVTVAYVQPLIPQNSPAPSQSPCLRQTAAAEPMSTVGCKSFGRYVLLGFKQQQQDLTYNHLCLR